ncbi:MAG: hypothetical protein ACWIPH_05510 [Ostreibacterium sp.]
MTNYAKQASTKPIVFLEMSDIFSDVGRNAVFRKQFDYWVNLLWAQGV